MDGERFDTWARALASPGPRRGALRLLAGGALAAAWARLGAAGAAADDDDGDGCRGTCDRCERNGQCCSNRCREGRCRCKARGACRVGRACCSGVCRRDGTCKPAATVACGGGGEPCNRTVCGRGEFCCNFSCSICAPVGGACTLRVCDQTDATGQFCGGIAAAACPAGYECVDDPNDECDPAAGGADCGGVCQPIE